jgi:MFS family permease
MVFQDMVAVSRVGSMPFKATDKRVQRRLALALVASRLITKNREDFMANVAIGRDASVYSEATPSELKRVVFASSLGTVFEWYDFYLYATLAPFFATLFFPPENPTAGILAAFGAYAAGFLVRPFGAVVFGRIGDLIGRKYTFLITMFLMGLATFAVGLLPTYNASNFFGVELPGIGWTAPLVLLSLRLIQGLALGGEYGGAATYVAEHTDSSRRGYATAWIQTTATLGFFLSLIIILVCRSAMDTVTFSTWGWRIPFLISLFLLAFSLYIRLKLNESPVFQKMKEEGKGSKHPLYDSFFRYPNNKYVLLALLGATAGQGVVWYTGQFYALFFLLGPLKVDYVTAYLIIAMTLLIGTPFFLFFGWLSDRIGRKWIILAGCLLAIVTYFPLFTALTETVNPQLAAFHAKNNVTVKTNPANCNFRVFAGPWSNYTDCDRAKNHLASLGINYNAVDAAPGEPEIVTIGATTIPIANFLAEKTADKITNAAKAEGWPAKASVSFSTPSASFWDVLMAALASPGYWTAVGIITIMVLYVTMVYGPIAAYLVELFPAKIRYTSMSLPYHIGNGWFGGLLPLLATSIVATHGSIYAGLWYPIGIAAMTLVVGTFLLHDTKGRELTHD